MNIIPRHHEQAVEVLRDRFGNEIITGFEVGTNAGDLTKTLLRDLPNLARLITCDPWKHFEGRQFEAGNPQEYHDEQKAAAFHKLKEFGDRVLIHQTKSDHIFKMIKASSIKLDFVWLDGDHTGEQVRKDIENALDVVCGGGLVGGHDYGLVDDVTAVVNSMFPPEAINKGGDFTWWVYL